MNGGTLASGIDDCQKCTNVCEKVIQVCHCALGVTYEAPLRRWSCLGETVRGLLLPPEKLAYSQKSNAMMGRRKTWFAQ